MKATFVITTYNRAKDLERCIDSILKQELSNIEIIIIDDASNDQTCNMVHRKYGEGVRLICQDKNHGSVKNRNYGAKLAGGDILFLIDDDTELLGNNIVGEVLKEFENPIVGAVAIPYLQDGHLHHGEPDSSSARFVRASYVGCACAVRKATFLALGGYEEFFYHQVEEDDFCIRMLNDGMVCLVGRVTKPIVHYESPCRNFYNWDFYGRRNSLLYIWKNCPAAYVIPNLVLTTLRGFFHALKIRRFKGNLFGLASGYCAIGISILGKGCKRNPVQKDVYELSRRLRKKPLPINCIEDYLIPPVRKSV